MPSECVLPLHRMFARSTAIPSTQSSSLHIYVTEFMTCSADHAYGQPPGVHLRRAVAPAEIGEHDDRQSVVWKTGVLRAGATTVIDQSMAALLLNSPAEPVGTGRAIVSFTGVHIWSRLEGLTTLPPVSAASHLTKSFTVEKMPPSEGNST